MPENTAIMLCEACAQLGTLGQTAHIHNALLEQTSKSVISNGSLECRFFCTDCGTTWLRLTDKWGIHGSFRLAPNTQIEK